MTLNSSYGTNQNDNDDDLQHNNTSSCKVVIITNLMVLLYYNANMCVLTSTDYGLPMALG